MKTDKLLQLIQQKRVMRSGGALPLPKAQDGLPNDYQQFLEFSKTAPENRRPSSDWKYGNPRQYDHYGMWDGLGKPKNWEEALKNNPDWQPDPYDGSYHGFSTNPNTGVWLKSHIPGEHEPGSTAWMENLSFALMPGEYGPQKNSLVYDPELQRMRYVSKERDGGSLPKAQAGVKPFITSDPNLYKQRLQAYNDSVYTHNLGLANLKYAQSQLKQNVDKFNAQLPSVFGNIIGPSISIAPIHRFDVHSGGDEIRGIYPTEMAVQGTDNMRWTGKKDYFNLYNNPSYYRPMTPDELSQYTQLRADVPVYQRSSYFPYVERDIYNTGYIDLYDAPKQKVIFDKNAPKPPQPPLPVPPDDRGIIVYQEPPPLMKRRDIQQDIDPSLSFDNERVYMQPIRDVAPQGSLQPMLRMVPNPKFNVGKGKRTKEAVVDELGNPRYVYYNGDNVISKEEYSKLWDEQNNAYAQGGSLPIAQSGMPLWQQLTNQALSQNNASNVRDNVTVAPRNLQAQSTTKDIATYGSIERAAQAKAARQAQANKNQSKIYQKEEDKHYNPEQEEYRDDTTLAPEGSTRATAQDYLNKANMFMGFGLNPAAKFVYDAFVSAPAQSAINLSNTAMGDRPIRGDEDVVNFGWDVANVAPFIGSAAKGTRKFINAFDQAGRIAFGALPEMGIFPKSFSNLFEETGNIGSNNLKNLKDLKEAQKFAKKYGYTLPSDLERIAQSDVLTDRVVRGMMDRHNTFVRGVSTNWEELSKRSPKIIKDLEDLGFNLSTEEGSRQAAEYMSTHIPGQTGYGRFGLKPGENALYLSNSMPTAEGYTYGNGYIVKAKRPTDFSSINRKDWITANEFDASLGFKNSPYGTGVVKNDYVKRLPTNFRELLATTGDPKTFDEVQKVIKKAEEKYRDLAHESWRDHNNKISKYVRERSAKARNNVWRYDGKIVKDELNGFDEYYISLLEKKKNLLNAYYGNAPAIPVVKHILGNADIWKSVGKNLFGQLDPFSHYAIKGQPGEKVLDAIQSIKVTPETWENTSRMHVNKYSNKLSRREEGGELTSEKAFEMLHDGTANGKPLTAAQKRYFGYIANKNKTKRHG